MINTTFGLLPVLTVAIILAGFFGMALSEEKEAMEQPENLDNPDGDRVNLEYVSMYGNENITLHLQSAQIRPWTKLKHVRYAENGNELLAFDEKYAWWTTKGAFYPLYRVKGQKALELYGGCSSLHGEMISWQFSSLDPKVFVQPGQELALDPTVLQPVHVYRVYTRDGKNGLINIAGLEAVGDPGMK
jgi:hypothetical protein